MSAETFKSKIKPEMRLKVGCVESRRGKQYSWHFGRFWQLQNRSGVKICCAAHNSAKVISCKPVGVRFWINHKHIAIGATIGNGVVSAFKVLEDSNNQNTQAFNGINWYVLKDNKEVSTTNTELDKSAALFKNFGNKALGNHAAAHVSNHSAKLKLIVLSAKFVIVIRQWRPNQKGQHFCEKRRGKRLWHELVFQPLCQLWLCFAWFWIVFNVFLIYIHALGLRDGIAINEINFFAILRHSKREGKDGWSGSNGGRGRGERRSHFGIWLHCCGLCHNFEKYEQQQGKRGYLELLSRR